MANSTIQPKAVKKVEAQPQGQKQEKQAAPAPSLMPGNLMAGHIQRDPRTLTPNSILHLQRAKGNHAVGAMLGVNHVTQVTPAPQRSGVIQRKYEGELDGKSNEEILELIDKAGYLVRGSFLKNKIEQLRNSTAPLDTYSTLEALIKALGLTRKPTTKETPPVSQGINFKLPTKTPSKVQSESPSTEPKTVKEEGPSPIKKIGPPKGPVSQEIGGGTSWSQESRHVNVTGKAKEGQPPQDFGQLSMTYKFTPQGLDFRANVFSNPKLIWERGDKVTISLQFKNGVSHYIGDLRVQKTGNIVDLVGTITFTKLAGLLGLPTPEGTIEEKREALAEASAQMGLLAMWRTKDDVGEQHRSGGIDQKGGSGLINVSATPINTSSLKKTEDEGIRNVGWNENEIARVGRPLVQSFPNLIKLGEEIATTLEAESEYMVKKEGYEQILAAMSKFTREGKEELLEKFGIQKEVEPSVKNYVDTYYDLDLSTEETKDDSLPLLEHNIVFRHRSVPKNLNDGKGDPEGTNLIAIKGRSVKDGDEAIRLAAQFQSQYDLLREDKRDEVLNFLRTEQVDNPFARTMLDALGEEDKGLLTKARGIKKALTVTSKRTKYKLWLVNSTMIDLSVDEAKGTMEGYPEHPNHVVYSFEFGVGHPGLTTGSTGGSGLSEEDPTLMRLQKELDETPDIQTGTKVSKLTSVKNRQEKTNKLVHRPYHVPKDLENKRLFQKGDYIQYMNLRDDLIKRLFRMEKVNLKRGGNKAKVLAKRIKKGKTI